MSKYTTEVRYICQQYIPDDSSNYLSVNSIIEKSLPKIFDFHFPIFDENYRSVLETKILKHYYTREIAFESVGLWKLKLDTKLNEIMPYFNKLYESELLSFNPLFDVDYNTTHKLNRNENSSGNGSAVNETNRTNDTTSSGKVDSNETGKVVGNSTVDVETNVETNLTENSESENSSNTDNSTSLQSETKSATTNTEMYSDTPQGSIENLETGKYLTNAKKQLGSDTTTNTSTTSGSVKTNGSNTTSKNSDSNTDTNSTTTSNNTTNTTNTESETNSNTSNTKETNNTNSNYTDSKTITSTDDYIEHVTGKTGGMTYSKMIMEFRDTFLNIDLLVIKELEPLFFQLW